MKYGFERRPRVTYGDKLGSISQIRPEPLISNTTYSIMIEFSKENFMVNRIEGFLQVYKYTTRKLTLIKTLTNTLYNVEECMNCGVTFAKTKLFDKDSLEVD